MIEDLTPRQAKIMEIVVDRYQQGKPVTIRGISTACGLPLSEVESAFRKIRQKGYVTLTDGTNHAVLRNMDGSAFSLPTYRRVAEDGVEVTQCPPMPARGYGLHAVDQDW